jgi:hypothetical protein
MKITLGDDAALTEETIIETLDRVTAEIRREEAEKVVAELGAHDETRQELAYESEKRSRLQERLYWKCDRLARRITRFVGVVVLILLTAGLLTGVGMKTENPFLAWFLLIGSGVSLVFSVAGYWTGTTVKGLEDRLHKYVLVRLLKRESKATGVILSLSS